MSGETESNEELKCYSCGDRIVFDEGRPECYCNDCGSMSNVDLQKEITRLQAELDTVKKERDHWKANHADVVTRNAAIVSRLDVPIERTQHVNLLVDQISVLKAQLKQQSGLMQLSEKEVRETLTTAHDEYYMILKGVYFPYDYVVKLTAAIIAKFGVTKQQPEREQG